MGASRASRVGILRGPVRPESGWPIRAAVQCPRRHGFRSGAVGWKLRRELCLAEMRRQGSAPSPVAVLACRELSEGRSRR